MDPVPSEDLKRAVVHHDREIDRELTLAAGQHLAHAVIKMEPVGRPSEMTERAVKRALFRWPVRLRNHSTPMPIAGDAGIQPRQDVSQHLVLLRFVQHLMVEPIIELERLVA